MRVSSCNLRFRIKGCCLPGRDQASGPMQQAVCRLRRIMVSGFPSEAMTGRVAVEGERES